MSSHEGHRRIDRDIAEQLLRGGPAAWRTGHHRLAGLLDSAAAPAGPDELIGQPEALAAFRAAALDPLPQPRRWHMIKASIAKLLTVKIAAICGAATLGLGGVAVAATTGNLPGPLNFGNTPGSHPTDHSTAFPSGGPRHTPSPSALLALCRDYLQRDHDHRRQALDDQSFHDLVDRVGGRDRDRADFFCDQAVRDGATAFPSAPPNGGSNHFPSTRPSDGPSHAPTSRPTNGPGPIPTVRPSKA